MRSELELNARRLAAQKMRLVRDPEGINLPDDLWQQAIPAARAERAEAERITLLSEIDRLNRLVYVPGLWRCPKCKFNLVQANLNGLDGTVTARDQPGDKCPNCDSPLWRVSERDAGNEMIERADEQKQLTLAAEAERDAARAVLRTCEWVGRMHGVKICPVCCNREERDGGHTPGCALAAAIDSSQPSPDALREDARSLEIEAWRRQDGGQELTLRALELEREADRLEAALAPSTPPDTPIASGQAGGPRFGSDIPQRKSVGIDREINSLDGDLTPKNRVRNSVISGQAGEREEKVADGDLTLRDKDHWETERLEHIHKILREARAAALEEAAKVALTYPDSTEAQLHSNSAVCFNASMAIMERIRFLASRDTGSAPAEPAAARDGGLRAKGGGIDAS